MRKLLLLLIIPVFFSACKKEETNKCTYTTPVSVAPASEVTFLQNWLASEGIQAIQDNSGLFYVINSPGAGASPEVCKTIDASYTGKFLNGGIFETSPGSTFLLGQLVDGWQIGLPKIKSGGSITLYIPPTLGYGNREIRDQNGSVRIPANSYLIFTIQVTQVNE
ncbi:MAG: FKBP-type peptidyl-prolyl cis-trans isomerase [Ferruginibacter sp.]